MNPDWRPRLSIEINEKQANDLRNYIPFGLQGQIFRLIIDDLIELMERKGPAMVLSAYLERIITLENIAPMKEK